MTLLELLVKELPKRGGWPDDVFHATQDSDGQVNRYGSFVPNCNGSIWTHQGFSGYLFDGEEMDLCEDWHTSIITLDQYEAALAASQQPIAEFHSRTFPTFKAITVVERDDSWVGTKVDGEDYHCYKRHWEIEFISQQPVWNGEGLPPVGAECEFTTIANYKEHFVRAKVIAYGEKSVFMQHWASKNEFIHSLDKIKFRQIRTEAERKREEVAESLIRFLDSKTDIDNVFRTSDVMGFIDYVAAGKIPGVELTK